MQYNAAYAHQYDSLPSREMAALRWRFIQQHLDLPLGSRVLDIGYGNGAFLKFGRSAGMEIYGIDVHNEDFGIPTVTYDTPIEYDLICFFDSLEHFSRFDQPRSLRARHVMVSIPNAPSFLLCNPTAWRHYKPGEHLHYFSSRSLDRFMREWGFPIRVAHGFPEDEIRGKLQYDYGMHDNIYTAIYSRAAE
jgi:hypothetical protein